MKRRTLLKGALATGVLASASGRMAMASLSPAKDAVSIVRLDGSGFMLSGEPV